MQGVSLANRAEAVRWRGALDLLTIVRRNPGITRSAAARAVGLSSGSATEITARLRALDLLDERPARPTARGRPTTTLHASPAGPLAAVLDVRHEDWHLAVADLEGHLIPVMARRHADRSQRAVLANLSAALRAQRRVYRRRLRIVSVAVAGTVAHNRLVQASPLGWEDVDLSQLTDPTDAALPLLVGNDANLAGVAETRRGAARSARAALHLTIEVGLGGVLVTAGRAVAGASGAGGEFGHLPFGDPAIACPCGARGCWDLEVDGRAMARHRGDPPPADPRRYAAATLGEAATNAAAAEAVDRCARALGAGTAGLVNALDPDVVTLGGIAAELHQVAHDPLMQAYTAGLMRFRRQQPPPLQPATLGANGALVGAADVAIDHLLSEDSLTSWAAEVDLNRLRQPCT